MSNYIEYEDKIAFHPGYYIHELTKQSGLTLEEYAGKIGISAETLQSLIQGELSLTMDIAGKLSQAEGTSVNYWMNLQKTYDSVLSDSLISSAFSASDDS